MPTKNAVDATVPTVREAQAVTPRLFLMRTPCCDSGYASIETQCREQAIQELVCLRCSRGYREAELRFREVGEYNLATLPDATPVYDDKRQKVCTVGELPLSDLRAASKVLVG